MSQKFCYISNKEPFGYTLSIVSGKWKLKIIYLLACMGTLRYGALKKNIHGITHKMLSSQLKDLENEVLYFERNILKFLQSRIFSYTKGTKSHTSY